MARRQVGSAEDQSKFHLKSVEHATLALQLALQREAQEEKAAMPPKGAIGAPPVRRERRHIPLLPLADLCSQAAGVKSVEALRDVAAAL